MLPLSARLTFYNTMIKPIFEYNSIVWGDKRNTVHMDTLQILQNRAAKIILGRDLRDSATQALKDLNWLTLVKKRTIDECIFVYICLNNLIEFDFGKDWNTIDLETRNTDNLTAFKKSIVKIFS